MLRVLRACVVIIFLLSILNALDISATQGKHEGESFSVLTLKDDEPFYCNNIKNVYGKSIAIECMIDKIPSFGFAGLENNFFYITYNMVESKFWLYIHPKKQQTLFGIASDPKSGLSIQATQPEKARIWQIVGYTNEVPFLSKQTANGLNFPIKIEGLDTPFIPELNTDNNLLQNTKTADFVIYKNIEKLIEKNDYQTALVEINGAINASPNSIFRRDLEFAKIIVVDKLKLEDKEPLINVATDWLKRFPNDIDTPNIMYILAKAYMQDFNQKEADYYLRRITIEYPESKFTPLANMQLAKLYEIDSRPTHARINFQKAYEGAHDIESASEIALNWAKFEIERNDIKSATDLILKVIEANPNHFLLNADSKFTNEYSNFLADNNLFILAAKIAEIYANGLDKKTHENLKDINAFKIGEYYALAKDFDSAHKANLDYIKNYSYNTKQVKLVEQRDDAILFDISGDEDKKLEIYKTIMEKYPNSPEYEKAKKLSTDILLKRKDYEKVLELNDEQNTNIALNELVKEALSKNDCNNVNKYLLSLKEFNLDSAQRLKAFDCTYNAGLHTIAKNLSNGMSEQAKNEKEKLDWLYRIAKNLRALNESKQAVLAATDALNLAKSQKRHLDIAYDLFYILDSLNSKDNAKKIALFLQETFKGDEKLIPVYAKLLNYALGDKENLTIQTYANNIIALQNKFNTFDYSPFAEFALTSTLIEEQKLDEALKILNNLESKKYISNQERQRIFYQTASIYNTKNNKEKTKLYFKKCLTISDKTEWRDLCEKAESMLDSGFNNSLAP